MAPNLVSATLRGGLFTRVVGRRVLYYHELSSTMDEAARQAELGAEEGLVVVAETQASSRGRQGRTWVSQPGNLYLSVLFRPSLHVLPWLNMIGGVATARAIGAVSGQAPAIKWPNDILLGGKKTAGILAESALVGEQASHVTLGIGINVSLDAAAAPELAGLATSLNAAAGRPVPREDLLRRSLQQLDELYLRAQAGHSPLPQWKAFLVTLGQRVRVTWGTDTYEGLAEDVDDLGYLLLRQLDGRLLTLSAGDVTLRG